MADAVKMVVVNGVRYREEHAPKQVNTDAEAAEADAPEKKSRRVQNKARTTDSNK